MMTFPKRVMQFMAAQAIAEKRMTPMTDSQLESQYRHECRMAGDDMTPGLAACLSIMSDRGLWQCPAAMSYEY